MRHIRLDRGNILQTFPFAKTFKLSARSRLKPNQVNMDDVKKKIKKKKNIDAHTQKKKNRREQTHCHVMYRTRKTYFEKMVRERAYVETYSSKFL